ncbi:MAG: FtsH protease activity modulator HflK [Calditrichaceae bacterium]|nr:FtsH protease activity modulator HflK [Calditrichia bacterium]NUQ41987.1 FtsH protease activity modulator HflK [Calditrichaceae bacterium]
MQQRPPFDFNEFRIPRRPSLPPNLLKWIIPGVLLAIILFSSLFTVNTEEAGVILRFGRYTRTVDPGLNFKLPLGIEQVYKIPVRRQLKDEFGFRTMEGRGRSEYSPGRFQEESLMLTGDLNAAEVEWIVQYRIRDPYQFLFRVRNAPQTFRDMNEAVMREVVGDRTINEVLTVGRQEIASSVETKLQELCAQYELGIHVEQVVLQDVNPPDEVKASFNEVNEAQQEREKLINQARSEYNQVIPRARGDAARVIEESRGYALERVNRARGEAARFNSLFGEYQKAKEVTRQRIYIETLNKVMQKVGKKLILDEKAGGVLPLLDLDKGDLKK